MNYFEKERKRKKEIQFFHLEGFEIHQNKKHMQHLVFSQKSLVHD